MKRLLFSVAMVVGLTVLPVAASSPSAFAVNYFKVYAACAPGPFCVIASYPCVFDSFDTGNFMPVGSPVRNNCEVRVWLYQTGNWSGYSTCVSPGTAYDLGRSFQSAWVSSNRSAC